jgi:uncharacterized protein (DUF1499 family)
MKRKMMLSFILLFAASLAVLSYIRFATADIDRLHHDPAIAVSTGKPNEYRITSPVFDMTAPELTKMFDDFVLTQPRVKLVAGTLQDQMITYVQRTKIIGYPDYITIKVIPVGAEQSKLEILSRSRFGYSDLGVNKRRIDDWLLQLRR